MEKEVMSQSDIKKPNVIPSRRSFLTGAAALTGARRCSPASTTVPAPPAPPFRWDKPRR